MTNEYLEWLDANYRRLLTEEQSATAQLAYFQSVIESQKTTLRQHRKIAHLFSQIEHIRLLNRDLEIDSDIIEIVNNHYVNYANSAHNNVQNGLRNSESNFSYYEDLIAQTKERLTNLNNGIKKIHIPTVKRLLKDFPYVVPRSLSFSNVNDTPYIKWRVKGIKMVPSDNPHRWIVPLGELPIIPVQSCVVKVILSTGVVTINPARNEQQHCHYLFSGRKRAPHPHILSGNRPCLGDFQGPFAEAVSELDFLTMFTLINLFLQRAIETDSAGKNWVNYFKNFVPYGHVDQTKPEFFLCRFVQSSYRCQFVEFEPGLYTINKYSVSGNEELIESIPHPLNGQF